MPQSFTNRPHYAGTAQRGVLRSPLNQPSRSSSFLNKKKGSWWHHHQELSKRGGWIEPGYGGRSQGGRWTRGGGTVFTRHYNIEEPSILNRAKAESDSQTSTSSTEQSSKIKEACTNTTPVPPEYECCWFEYIAWEVNSRPRASSWHGDTSDRLDDFLDFPCGALGEVTYNEEYGEDCPEKVDGSEQVTWTNYSQPEQIYRCEETGIYYSNVDWEYSEVPDLQLQQQQQLAESYDSSAVYYSTQTGEEYYNTGVVHSGAQYFEFNGNYYPEPVDWLWECCPQPPPAPPPEATDYDHLHQQYGAMSTANPTEDECSKGSAQQPMAGLRLTPV